MKCAFKFLRHHIQFLNITALIRTCHTCNLNTLFTLKVACETFCLDENDSVKDAKNALGTMPLTEETVKFAKTSEALPLKTALETGFRKHLLPCKVKETKNLINRSDEKMTIFVDLGINVSKQSILITITCYILISS